MELLKIAPPEAIATAKAKAMQENMTLEERNMYSDAVLANNETANEETTKLRVAVRKKLSETFDATNYSVTCRNCGATTPMRLHQIFLGLMEFSASEINETRAKNGNYNKTDRSENLYVASGLSVIEDVYCCGQGRQTALDAHDVAMHVARNMDFTPKYVETRRQHIVADSNIPESLFSYTLRTFVADTEKLKTVLTTARHWLTATIKGARDGLILIGESRTGKTHLSIAMLHELLTEGKSVRFMSYPEWSDKLFNRTYKEFVTECEKCDVLLIDDFAHGTPAPEMTKAVLSLIEKRAGKITIYNTNYQGRDIKAKYGAPILNRIIDHCRVSIKFDGVKPRSVK